MSNVRKRLSNSVKVTTVLCSALALTACSTGRVTTLKEQFCDFDNNFSYAIGERPYFAFERPVLVESDIDNIVGYEPTELIQDGDEQVHRYVIEKFTLENSEQQRYVLDLRYRKYDGAERLSSIHLPGGMGFAEELELALDPVEIAAAAQEICDARVKFRLGPSEEDIEPERLAKLPLRDDILAMMGPPSWESDEENALIYEYRFLGDQENDNPLKMVIWFDESNTLPTKMETHYRFLRSEADFEQGKIRYTYQL